MSVELVKSAMKQFLLTSTPEVLCVKGKWGTGKTYAWNSAVKEAKAANRMAIQKYSYVSLFGMNDPSDIMQSIFANTNHVEAPESNYIDKDKINGIANKLKRLVPFALEHTNSVPYISGLGGIAKAVVTNLVMNTVVCIDDFERKNKNIFVNDIMGTIAQLRDARKCKVVLILNDDTLQEDELADFTKYSEKVINWSFRFDPSPEESTQIAFPGNDNLSKELREACCQLEITNIRVLYKIHGFATRLSELLSDVDQYVVGRVIRSLVVIVWSIVTPKGEGAASLEFIKRNRLADYLTKKDRVQNADEQRLASILDRYGFTHFDEFDQIISEDVENGFFNDAKIRVAANKYLKDAERARAEASLEEAWGLYHASFDANEEEVALAMFAGNRDNIKYVSEPNLSSAVTILRDIGYPELGSQLVNVFLETRDNGYVFDRYLWDDMVSDPELIEAIERLSKNNTKPLPTPEEAAEVFYSNNWTSEAERVLDSLSVDQMIVRRKTDKE